MLNFKRRLLTDSEIARYRDDGFFIYGAVVEDRDVRVLQAEAARLWEAAHKDFDAGASWNQNAILNGVHRESPLMREIMYRSALVDVMTQVIGANIKAASNQLVFKSPNDERPYDWHQDNGFGPLEPATTVSCWMALDDVHEKNGCLWVIPGSHKNGRLEHRAERGRERIAAVENEESAVPVLLKAGECVFFHGDLLHKSNGNSTDKMRRAFFYRYADADAIETLTGEPRVGRLLRGTSRFPEVTNCPETVCQPAKNDALSAAEKS
ncbi:MAG TPA: phytanoyl-CoA dioxygenase family protein [Pyrinomonadaceae bacterium]|jgi:ectoine hydroxylase-related dioxygenase (phytanoyl-CoA dioxygenase family)